MNDFLSCVIFQIVQWIVQWIHWTAAVYQELVKTAVDIDGNLDMTMGMIAVGLQK